MRFTALGSVFAALSVDRFVTGAVGTGLSALIVCGAGVVSMSVAREGVADYRIG